MKRKKPSFNEAYHGYRTFSELLEDAQREGLLELDTDKRSRTYVVTRFGSELKSPAPATPAPKKPVSRRRRSSSRRRMQVAVPGAPPATDAEPPAAVAHDRAHGGGDSMKERSPQRTALTRFLATILKSELLTSSELRTLLEAGAARLLLGRRALRQSPRPDRTALVFSGTQAAWKALPRGWCSVPIMC